MLSLVLEAVKRYWSSSMIMFMGCKDKRHIRTERASRNLRRDRSKDKRIFERGQLEGNDAKCSRSNTTCETWQEVPPASQGLLILINSNDS